MTFKHLSEIRWNTPKHKAVYVPHDVNPGDPEYAKGGNKFVDTPSGVKLHPTTRVIYRKELPYDDAGKPILKKTFYEPGFRAGRHGKGDILGTVGDWLDLMGATREDVAEARRRVAASPEYRELLKLAEDHSSEGDIKNGTFNFVAYVLAPLDPRDINDPVHSRRPTRIRRKVLANGTIRTFANWGDYHAGRGKAPHPMTKETHPDLTPVERVERTMRASMKELALALRKSMEKAFTRELERGA